MQIRRTLVGGLAAIVLASSLGGCLTANKKPQGPKIIYPDVTFLEHSEDSDSPDVNDLFETADVVEETEVGYEVEESIGEDVYETEVKPDVIEESILEVEDNYEVELIPEVSEPKDLYETEDVMQEEYVCDKVDWYLDWDEDGFGAGPVVEEGCVNDEVQKGYSLVNTDCDDGDKDFFPGETKDFYCSTACDEGVEKRFCKTGGLVDILVGCNAPLPGNEDLDGNGVFDADEINGIDENCDGVIDMNGIFYSGMSIKGHTVGDFYINEFEVPIQAYKQCVAEGECIVPGESGNAGVKAPWYNTEEMRPMTGVTQSQAADYCEWSNGRLPTEWEWEVAATNGGDCVYPTGNSCEDPFECLDEDQGHDCVPSDINYCNQIKMTLGNWGGCSGGQVADIDALTFLTNGPGYNFGASVQEWVNGDNEYDIRGGSVNSADEEVYARADTRYPVLMEAKLDVGFRCAR